VLQIDYPRTRFGYMSSGFPSSTDLAPAAVSDFTFDAAFDRDVEIAATEIAEIDAGERLAFGPGDAGNHPAGRDASLVELIVRGTLRAEGESGNRIRFESGADPAAAGDWMGLRFDLSGTPRAGYGYLGCDVEPPRLESVTISDCVVPISIENHCAPGLADVDWSQVASLPNSSPETTAHVLLDSTDVEIPAGWWMDQQGTPVFQEDPVGWDLDHPTNIVATPLRSTAEDLDAGNPNRVDLIVTGRINATGTNNIVMRPAARNDADGDDWGGLTISSPFRNQLNRLDIGHAANPVFFYYPDSSSGLTQSTIHHFADLGLWVAGSGSDGAIFQQNTITQGTGLDPDLGDRGVLLDRAPNAAFVGNGVILQNDQTTTGVSAAVTAYFGKTFCQSQGNGLEERLSINNNTVLGNPQEEDGDRSGIRLDWVCGDQDRHIDVLENYVSGWNASGLSLFQSVDAQLNCNHVTDCTRAVDVDRNAEPQGSGLRFRHNLLKIDENGSATIRSDNALMTKLGPNTAAKGWNDLHIPEWDFLDPRYFVDENDPGTTPLNATYQYWFENGNLVTDSLTIITRIDQTAGVDISNFADTLPVITPAQLCVPGASSAALRSRGEGVASADRLPPGTRRQDQVKLDLSARWAGNRPVVEVSIPAGREGPWRLTIYDVRGRVVRDWVGELGAGKSRLEFQRMSLPSGVFFVRLTGEGVPGITRKLVVIH
jgi:hypothetical protein